MLSDTASVNFPETTQRRIYGGGGEKLSSAIFSTFFDSGLQNWQKLNTKFETTMKK